MATKQLSITMLNNLNVKLTKCQYLRRTINTILHLYTYFWPTLYTYTYSCHGSISVSCLFLVLMMYVDEIVWKISWLLIVNLTNESVYRHGTGRISNCLNRPTWGSRFCISYNSDTFFLWSINIRTFWRFTPQNYSIFSIRLKICVVYWFESVLLTWTIDLTA
jgi:hypothetical protein